MPFLDSRATLSNIIRGVYAANVQQLTILGPKMLLKYHCHMRVPEKGSTTGHEQHVAVRNYLSRFYFILSMFIASLLLFMR